LALLVETLESAVLDTGHQGAIFMKSIFLLSVLILLFPTNSSAVRKKCEITESPTYQVQVKSTKEYGIVGELVQPIECLSSAQNLILVLGGSEGGIPTYIARPLAERGMTTLALGYFGVQGESLPASIDKIPLEYFENALTKLQAIVPDSKCCAVLGFSKGSEGGLAFASIVKPSLRGLILLAGTDTAFEGFDSSGSGQSTQNSGWTYLGNQILFSPYVIPDQTLLAKMFPMGFSRPPVLKPFYDATIGLPSGTKGALPVEQISGPILLLTGQDDQVWSSSQMSEKVVERAKAKNFKYEVNHFSFPKVGHFVLFGETMLQVDPYNATRFGGTVEGSKAAEPLVWLKITDFLRSAYQ
jgi:uncharacterized protein